MYYLSAADVDSYMARVTYYITCLSISYAAYITTHAPVSTGGVGQRYTEVPVYAHYEARAVSTIGK